MAEKTIDKAIETAGLEFSPSKTKDLKIHGWLDKELESHLSIYGSDAVEIQQLMETDITLTERIHSRYPYTKAEIIWFIENEMAITLEDLLARRLRLLFLDANAAMEAAPIVAKILASQTGKDIQWEQNQINAFYQLAKGYLISF
jgi:glycerol-3-phosphate dehydrogenase